MSVQAGRIMLVESTAVLESVSEGSKVGIINTQHRHVFYATHSILVFFRVVMLSSVERLSREVETHVSFLFSMWERVVVPWRLLHATIFYVSLISTKKKAHAEVTAERTHQKLHLKCAHAFNICCVWDFREEKRNESRQNRCHPDRN